MEDPRIVKIEDLLSNLYRFDGINAWMFVVSKDLVHLKEGVIVPQITFEDFNELAESLYKTVFSL
jgi:hypothetical protein